MASCGRTFRWIDRIFDRGFVAKRNRPLEIDNRKSFVPLTFYKKPALIVYVTCGDPDLATTRDVVLAAIEAGTDVIELGVPLQRSGRRWTRDSTRQRTSAEAWSIVSSSAHACGGGTPTRAIDRTGRFFLLESCTVHGHGEVLQGRAPCGYRWRSPHRFAGGRGSGIFADDAGE